MRNSIKQPPMWRPEAARAPAVTSASWTEGAGPAGRSPMLQGAGLPWAPTSTASGPTAATWRIWAQTQAPSPRPHPASPAAQSPDSCRTCRHGPSRKAAHSSLRLGAQPPCPAPRRRPPRGRPWPDQLCPHSSQHRTERRSKPDGTAARAQGCSPLRVPLPSAS